MTPMYDGSDPQRLSINDLNYMILQKQNMILCEGHSEVKLLPYMLKITKTDFGVALGLPSEFWDGSYDGDNKRMIRLQHIIHNGAWKKNLLRPNPRNLPPGFTLVHFSLKDEATCFTRFFLYHYSQRYRALPDESKPLLYNGARACAIWESFEEKIRLQEAGIQAFACPWVYEQIVKGRELFNQYPQRIIEINKAAKAYRNSRGRYGYSAAVAYDRRQDAYTTLNTQVLGLAADPPPTLPPLPTGTPEFLLLEEPPREAFEEGA